MDAPRLNRSGLLPSGAFDPQVQRVLQALEVLALEDFYAFDLEDNHTITYHYRLLCLNFLDLVLCSISIDLVVAYSYFILCCIS